MPLSTLRERLDLLVRTKNGATYGFELKYKTQAVTCGLAGEAFEVRNHGAPDHGQYDFLKDVMRLEQFVAQPNWIGYALLLSNG